MKEDTSTHTPTHNDNTHSQTHPHTCRLSGQQRWRLRWRLLIKAGSHWKRHTMAREVRGRRNEQRQKAKETIKLCIYWSPLHICVCVCACKKVAEYLNRESRLFTRHAGTLPRCLPQFGCVYVCVWQMGNWISRWTKTNPIAGKDTHTDTTALRCTARI